MKSSAQKTLSFVLFFTALTGLLTIAAISIANLGVVLDKSQTLGASTQNTEAENLAQEALFWLDLVERHPTYRDGYLELWDIMQKLGDEKKAQQYLEIAKNIDPN